MQLKLNN